MIVIELETGVYLAPWDGDPGRTLKIDSAKKFRSDKIAKQALKNDMITNRFPNADILKLD